MKDKSTGRKKPQPRVRNAASPAQVPVMNFPALVDAIRQVHEHCAAQATRAVNLSLTLRNWVIGGYIHHYELNGQDRAKYGDAMIDRLAAELAKRDVTTCERQRLYSYLAFFRTYPQIAGAIPAGTLPPLRLRLASEGAAIVRSMTGQSGSAPSRTDCAVSDRTIGRDGPDVAGSAVLHSSRTVDGYRRSSETRLLRD